MGCWRRTGRRRDGPVVARWGGPTGPDRRCGVGDDDRDARRGRHNAPRPARVVTEERREESSRGAAAWSLIQLQATRSRERDPLLHPILYFLSIAQAQGTTGAWRT